MSFKYATAYPPNVSPERQPSLHSLGALPRLPLHTIDLCLRCRPEDPVSREIDQQCRDGKYQDGGRIHEQPGVGSRLVASNADEMPGYDRNRNVDDIVNRLVVASRVIMAQISR